MSLIKVAYWGHDYEGHGTHGAAIGGGLGALPPYGRAGKGR